MKTPTIATPTSINSGAKSPVTSSGGLPDTQFNQVLSREMADRRSVAQAGNAAVEENQPSTEAPQAPRTADPAAKTDTVDAGDEKSPSADATSIDSGKDKGTVEAGDQDDMADLSTASDELLALVANVNLVAPHQSVPTGQTSKRGSEMTASLKDSVSAPDTAGAQKLAVVQREVAETAGITDPASDRSAPDTALRTPELRAVARRAGAAGPDAASDKSNIRATSGELAAPVQADAKSAQTGVTQTAFTATQQQGSSFAAQPVVAGLSETNSGADQQLAATSVASLMPAQITPPQPQAVAGDAATLLAPQVGSRAWDQALGQKIVWMVNDGQQSAALTLNPPDLGPLQVVLSVTNNHATANFTAAQPEVRQALETAMPKLREMLGDAGIQLGQTSVSAGTPHDQPSTFGDQQRSSHHAMPASEISDTTVRVSHSHPIASGRGLLDTFA